MSKELSGERVAFEAWATHSDRKGRFNVTACDGVIIDRDTRCSWYGWQAALASKSEGAVPTQEQIELFAAKLVADGKLNWAGFRKDENSSYTIPLLNPAVYDLVS